MPWSLWPAPSSYRATSTPMRHCCLTQKDSLNVLLEHKHHSCLPCVIYIRQTWNPSSPISVLTHDEPDKKKKNNPNGTSIGNEHFTPIIFKHMVASTSQKILNSTRQNILAAEYKPRTKRVS